MKYRVIKIFVFIVILLVISAVLVIPRLRKNKASESTLVTRGEVVRELKLSGKIDSKEKASLSFPSSGLIAWVGVKNGDKVYKNQVIASIDTRILQKTLAKNLNNYLRVRRDFEQIHDDHRDEVLTDKLRRIYEKSQADLDNSVLDVEIYDLQIKQSVVTAPINGIVTETNLIYPGMQVLPSQAQFEVVNPNSLFFDVTADQTEVVKLKIGDKMRIVLDSYPDSQFEGIIESIAFTPRKEESSTVYQVRVKLNDIDAGGKVILIGMTGEGSVIEDERNGVLRIQPKFIKSDLKGKFVLKGDSKAKVYVEVGFEGEDFVEIKGVLGEGDKVYLN